MRAEKHRPIVGNAADRCTVRGVMSAFSPGGNPCRGREGDEQTDQQLLTHHHPQNRKRAPTCTYRAGRVAVTRPKSVARCWVTTAVALRRLKAFSDSIISSTARAPPRP